MQFEIPSFCSFHGILMERPEIRVANHISWYYVSFCEWAFCGTKRNNVQLAKRVDHFDQLKDACAELDDWKLVKREARRSMRII
jgi:hypothetical protein